MPTSTSLTRLFRPERLGPGLAIAVLAGLATPSLAQSLPRPPSPPINDPLDGHSAHYYGMSAPAQQEASIRSVLTNVGVDQAFLPRSLGAETARFLVGLVLGGVGAPTDLVKPGQDLRKVEERE